MLILCGKKEIRCLFLIENAKRMSVKANTFASYNIGYFYQTSSQSTDKRVTLVKCNVQIALFQFSLSFSSSNKLM